MEMAHPMVEEVRLEVEVAHLVVVDQDPLAETTEWEEDLEE